MSTDYNPFQSPATPLQLGDGRAWPIKPFEPGHTRAVWTIVILAVAAVTNVLRAGWIYLFYRSVMAGEQTPIDSVSGLIGWAGDVAIIGSIIAFSMWTHRVYRNLPALGARLLRHTPGWAVGWLFIPFANLVVPYFIFAEIWRDSIPAQADSTGGSGKRISPLLIGWWIVNILPVVVLVAGIVGFVVAVYFGVGLQAGIEPEQVAWLIADRTAALVFLAAVVVPLLGSAAAVLAIFVVRRIDKNQQAKYELIYCSTKRR
jgi:hypothetical protein